MALYLVKHRYNFIFLGPYIFLRTLFSIVKVTSDSKSQLKLLAFWTSVHRLVS